MRMKWLHTLVLFLALVPTTLWAQEYTDVADALQGQLIDPVVDGRQPNQDAQMLAIGAVNLLDTYLSQEKYTGLEVRHVSQRLRRLRRYMSRRCA